MSADSHAVVWSSTWVPNAPPVGPGDTEGYAVAWVDGPEGIRVQALVLQSTGAPAIGTEGVLGELETDEGALPTFTPKEGS